MCDANEFSFLIGTTGMRLVAVMVVAGLCLCLIKALWQAIK